MMMVALMGALSFQIGLQAGEGFLGARKIARFQGTDKALIIGIGLGILAKWLGR